jgi:hypothetical protein
MLKLWFLDPLSAEFFYDRNELALNAPGVLARSTSPRPLPVVLGLCEKLARRCASALGGWHPKRRQPTSIGSARKDPVGKPQRSARQPEA